MLWSPSSMEIHSVGVFWLPTLAIQVQYTWIYYACICFNGKQWSFPQKTIEFFWETQVLFKISYVFVTNNLILSSLQLFLLAWNLRGPLHDNLIAPWSPQIGLETPLERLVYTSSLSSKGVAWQYPCKSCFTSLLSLFIKFFELKNF